MNAAPPLYLASAPVFRAYLGRAAAMVERAGEAALQARIADALPAAQQFAAATHFALRVAFPLAGLPVPDLPQALAPRFAVARAVLGAMDPALFVGAEARKIRHRAGEADLEQDGLTFLYHYGLPNFFFHLTMAYATLRAAGVSLGKADFDGQHLYPAEGRRPAS